MLLLPVLLYPVFKWRLHPAQWMWPVYLGNYARFLWQADVVNNTSIFEDIRSRTYPAFAYQIPHLWSLCVEEQFYLVWPMVAFALRERQRIRDACLALVVAVPLLRMLALHVFTGRTLELGLLYRTTPMRADSLVLGAALAMCMRGPERAMLQRYARHVAALVLLLWGVVEGVCRVRSGHFLDPEWMKLYNAWGYSLLAVGAGCVIVLVMTPGSVLYRVCLHPGLRWLGVRSYGFYVYHLLLGQVWWMLGPGHKRAAGLLLPIVAMAGSAATAWASFKYFEAPILRLKERFA